MRVMYLYCSFSGKVTKNVATLWMLELSTNRACAIS